MNSFYRYLKIAHIVLSKSAMETYLASVGIFAGQLSKLWSLVDELHIIIHDIALIAVLRQDDRVSTLDAVARISYLRLEGGMKTAAIKRGLTQIANPSTVILYAQQIRGMRSAICKLKEISESASQLFLVADTFAERAEISTTEYQFWLRQYLTHTAEFLEAITLANDLAIKEMRKDFPAIEMRKCLASFSRVDRALFGIIVELLDPQKASESHVSYATTINEEAYKTRQYIKRGMELTAAFCEAHKHNQRMQSVLNVMPLYNQTFELEEKIVKTYLAVLEKVFDPLLRSELLSHLFALSKQRAELAKARLQFLKTPNQSTPTLLG